ncbi:enoyl-CoA hydratase/isomerase family protein [Kocuria rhizophila]|nr:enoyl-CoA hydratase/isomerase family protein [Kocuria rhizophila]
MYERLRRSPKPTIAAVKRAPFGGHELALACDIRIASTNAQFACRRPGWASCRRGRHAAPGQARGPRPATEIVLTGRRVKAEDALAMGLVTQVVEPDELLDTAARRRRPSWPRVRWPSSWPRPVIRQRLRRGPPDRDPAGARLAQSVLYSSARKGRGNHGVPGEARPRFPHCSTEGRPRTHRRTSASGERPPEGHPARRRRRRRGRRLRSPSCAWPGTTRTWWTSSRKPWTMPPSSCTPAWTGGVSEGRRTQQERGRRVRAPDVLHGPGRVRRAGGAS